MKGGAFWLRDSSQGNSCYNSKPSTEARQTLISPWFCASGSGKTTPLSLFLQKVSELGQRDLKKAGFQLWDVSAGPVMAWIGNSSWFNHLALQEHFRRYLNSTEDYLAFLCGPKRSHLFLPMALVYSVIFVVGVIGNFLVCLVILKHQNMKTPTNYYLFSLAVSDLLVLLFGMPLEVYEMWSNYPFLFGPIGCYFKTALFETVCFASILSVTTVSIERYFAILHPFRAKLESTRKRALRTIVVLWVLSVLFALPNTGTHGIMLQYFPNGTLVPGSATCTVVAPMWIYNWIVQITSFLFYVLPMGVISVLYYLMGLRVSPAQVLSVSVTHSCVFVSVISTFSCPSVLPKIYIYICIHLKPLETPLLCCNPILNRIQLCFGIIYPNLFLKKNLLLLTFECYLNTPLCRSMIPASQRFTPL